MIKFYSGEEKYIKAKIKPKNEIDTIVISSALFSLTNEAGVEVDSGSNPNDIAIDGLTLTILLSPPGPGEYSLKITVTVGAETLIEKATVLVAP